MSSKVDHWLGRLLPRHCALCGLRSAQRHLCRACLRDLPWIPRACRRCAAPLPRRAQPQHCARCELRLRGADRVLAALVYEYPVDELIASAKFDRRPELARAAGEALAFQLAATAEPERNWPDAVLPVPMHPGRLSARGFNQAQEIAAPVARRFGLDLSPALCRRRRDTPAQSGLGGASRRRNLRGAFVASGDVEGRHVAVVDDVLTTGSTISAVAMALRERGAIAVEAWVVARVVRRPPTATR